jgi:hypothetical protein
LRKVFFFDCDWIFSAEFIDKINLLLQIEGSRCACISNLDETWNGIDQRSFVIDQHTAEDDYLSVLQGGIGIENGWIYEIGRFGCMTEVGQWCIYCERKSEIAVIGIRKGVSLNKYNPVISQFRALPIEEAIERPLTYGFSPRALSTEWRNELLKQYKS